MPRSAHVALILLAVLAAGLALTLLSDIAAPMALALVTGAVLSPLQAFWSRIGLPRAAGAMASLVLALVLVGLIGLLLVPIVQQMVAQAPHVWADLQGVVTELRQMASGLDSMRAEVAPAAADSPSAVPTVTDALLVAPAAMAQLVTFVGTLFFFLLTRDEIYDSIARSQPDSMGRDELATRLRGAERLVSRYFITITLINLGLGVATAAALQALGVESAVHWGALAFLMNYVVYLGPVILTVALGLAGIAAFDGPMAAMPALAYGAIIFVESQFVTPTMVGKRLEMNALLVFVALLIGIRLWGPIGGIVAIPLMLWVSVLAAGKGQA